MSTATVATPSPRLPGQPWELNDVARFWGVSKKTIERRIKDGTLKAIRFGRRILIPDTEARRVAENGFTSIVPTPSH